MIAFLLLRADEQGAPDAGCVRGASRLAHEQYLALSEGEGDDLSFSRGELSGVRYFGVVGGGQETIFLLARVG